MTFHFGKKSRACLDTCHPALVYVAREALYTEVMDFGVIHGYRGKALQDSLYLNGKSTLKWPNSKHNKTENGEPYSWAIDIMIYVNGKASWFRDYYIVMSGVFLTCAKKLGIDIIWGGNWDGDAEPLTDQKLLDLGHYELAKPYRVIDKYQDFYLEGE